MVRSRTTYAVRRGVTMAVAAFAMALGLAQLSPSTPPNWPLLLGVPPVFGLAYATLLYFEVGPLRTPA